MLPLSLFLALPESGRFEATFGEAAETAWDAFAASVALAGVAIRMLTVGFESKHAGSEPAQPVAGPAYMGGLYSVVRHPLYLGNVVILLGLALAVKVSWIVPLMLAASGLLYGFVALWEEGLLIDRLGLIYRGWRSRTPAVLPNFSGWRTPGLRFSWRRALQCERDTLYHVIVGLFLIELATDIIGEGESVAQFLADDGHWLWLFAIGTLSWAALRFRESAIPARLRFWLLCLTVFLVVESADRVTLLFWSLAGDLALTSELVAAVPLGSFDDFVVALLLGAPFLAGFYAFAPALRRPVLAAAAHLLFLAMLAALVFIEAAQFLFWNEFDSRFNSIAVNYLIFPREVIGNIRESFDLAVLLPVVGVLAFAPYLPLRGALQRALRDDLARGERRRGFAVAAGALLLGVGGMLLNTTNVFSDRALNEAAKNGLHSFIEAALTNDQRYEGIYLGMPDSEALPIVRGMVAQDNTTFLRPASEPSLLRHVAAGMSPRKLNVVMILDESFGSTYVDGLDNDRTESISPRLSRLAKDGLFFTNVYATGNRTVRALEAVFTSFPPIPGISTARRSGSEGMNSLPFLLAREGYRTAFLYGGRSAFDNMGHFWSTVGFQQVWDQGDIADQGFTTIWGVADEYLYGEALKRFDALTSDGRPAFLAMLTVSNHRPYTYPPGRIDKDPAQKRRENAATYADWAFGDFIERARSHAWFRDTVFVFMGDHGPRVYGAAQVPVPSYRVPLLFYAPTHIAPQRNPVLGSNMDIAPTLLGLLGLSYDSPFFGVDLRRVPPGAGRIAMEHNFSVAVGDSTSVAMLLPGRGSRGYAMDIGPHELKGRDEPDPDMLHRTVALIQTAHHLFYSRRYHELGGPK